MTIQEQIKGLRSIATDLETMGWRKDSAHCDTSADSLERLRVENEESKEQLRDSHTLLRHIWNDKNGSRSVYKGLPVSEHIQRLLAGQWLDGRVKFTK